jgi:hypothetical protein
MGANSVIWNDYYISELWATYMTKGKDTNGPMPIERAWFTSALDAYRISGNNYPNTMFFAASGANNCTTDTLQNNSVPDGTYFYTSSQVWPPPR